MPHTARRIRDIETSYAFARHITPEKCRDLLDKLDVALNTAGSTPLATAYSSSRSASPSPTARRRRSLPSLSACSRGPINNQLIDDKIDAITHGLDLLLSREAGLPTILDMKRDMADCAVAYDTPSTRSESLVGIADDFMIYDVNADLVDGAAQTETSEVDPPNCTHAECQTDNELLMSVLAPMADQMVEQILMDRQGEFVQMVRGQLDGANLCAASCTAPAIASHRNSRLVAPRKNNKK